MLPTRQNLTPAEENTITNTAQARIARNCPNGTRAQQLCQWVGAFYDDVLAANIPSAVAVNTDYVRAFQLAMYNANQTFCGFCGGSGHEQRECMTLIKWTRAARDCGFGFHFGALKGLAYYRQQLRNMNPQ